MEARSVIEFIKWSQENIAAQMYRGQSDEAWLLLPGISRYYDITDQCGNPLSVVEDMLIEKFEFYAHPIKDFRKCSYLEKLVHAQHYGVPTRLLDWTTNPLKALYFAVSDPAYTHKDGVVYCFSPNSWWESISGEYIHKELDGEGLVTFHPELLNERIAAQEGCFTAFPLANDCIEIAELSPEAYPTDTESFGAVVIPADAKIDIRYELRKLGINHMTIYPGLEGIAKYVRSTYSGFTL